jgi:glucose/arabinose dehydrogenase
MSTESPPSRRPRRAVAVVVVAALVVAALVVVATQWRVLPWVPDAEIVGAADPPPVEPLPSDTAGEPGDDTGGGLPRLGRPVDVATGLSVPWGLTFLPDGSALVAERTTGRVLQVSADSGPKSVGEVPGVTPDGEGGLLGLAVSPTFSEDQNVYAYLTAASDNRILVMRLVRGELRDAREVLTGIPRASYHDGGRLLFGPDGMLYATTGDAGVPQNAQNLDSLAGKILRLAPDGSVPKDNPFPRSPVWSYGHRNVQGLAFDDGGRLWASEFGSSAFDELNLIEPGRNYGWPRVEGVGNQPGLVDPQVTWPTDQASPSGLAWVATGDGSAARGVLYMSALRGERLWQIQVTGDQAHKPVGALEDSLGRIRTVALGPDGKLWLTTSNTDGRGDPQPGDDRVVTVSIG